MPLLKSPVDGGVHGHGRQCRPVLMTAIKIGAPSTDDTERPNRCNPILIPTWLES